MEDSVKYIDHRIEVKKILEDFENKIYKLLGLHDSSKVSQTLSDKEIFENYFSPIDFELHLNLLSMSFVINTCHEAEKNGDLHLFGIKHYEHFKLKPIPFLEYIANRKGRCAPKTRRFLQNPISMGMIDEIFEKRKNH